MLLYRVIYKIRVTDLKKYISTLQLDNICSSKIIIAGKLLGELIK